MNLNSIRLKLNFPWILFLIVLFTQDSRGMETNQEKITEKESLSQIQIGIHKKKRLAQFLQSRLVRHRDPKTSLAQIKTELTQAMITYEKNASYPSLDRKKLHELISQQTTTIQSIEDKEVLLAYEEAQYEMLMTSDNCLGALTLALIESSHQPDQNYLLIFGLFTVPLDLVLFPFELLATLLTGGFN